MAREVLMPRLGNTVESVVIVAWNKEIGDAAAPGDSLCEVETDKATMEVEAEDGGVLLARLFEAGDEVPVLAPFAVIGEPGEDVSVFLTPGGGGDDAEGGSGEAGPGGRPIVWMPGGPSGDFRPGEADGGEGGRQGGEMPGEPSGNQGAPMGHGISPSGEGGSGGSGAPAGPGSPIGSGVPVSPRARRLAAESGLAGPVSRCRGAAAGLPASEGGSSPPQAGPSGDLPVSGSGPGGRIIERDIQALLHSRTPLTLAARAAVRGGPLTDSAAPPHAGTGIGGRITTADLQAAQGGPPNFQAAPAPAQGRPQGRPQSPQGRPQSPQGGPHPPQAAPAPQTTHPLTPIRKLIANRMHASLTETAQLTLNTTADAAALLQLRAQFKSAPAPILAVPNPAGPTPPAAPALPASPPPGPPAPAPLNAPPTSTPPAAPASSAPPAPAAGTPAPPNAPPASPPPAPAAPSPSGPPAPASSALPASAPPASPPLSAITINHIIMHTLAKLLPRHPELNAAFSPGGITRYTNVNLGFAVDSPRGLMVPVIPRAETLSLADLSARARRLADACRNGTIAPDELTGGTFTITNLGAFGIETFTPILNTPQVAILGVGAMVNTPVETPEGTIGIRKRIGLSLTIDHQAVDGAPAARFLEELTETLAHPAWTLAL